MCRLLAIVTSEDTAFRALLHDAPRSLAALSREHGDGWGLAVFRAGRGWEVHKSVLAADGDAGFHARAMESRGEVLVSHVRRKTVGDASIANTHPFARSDWIFAHNGTVRDLERLGARTSRERLAEIEGSTDSERLFAFVLTHLDEAGVTREPASERTDHALSRAAAVMRESADLGTANFLLSNGVVCYAQRFGLTLHVLERGPTTPASRRRRGVFIASESMTTEAWRPLDEGALVRIDRDPTPSWRVVIPT